MKPSAHRRRARDARLLGAFAVAILVVPATGALPDLGLWDDLQEIERSDPVITEAMPCNDQGILWSGLGQPWLAQAIQGVGAEACRRLMLEASLDMVRRADLVTGEVREDGDLHLRVVFPLLKTPILVPLRNQDPDRPGFLDQAVADAQADVERWVPLILDPNAGVPCTTATSGAPAQVVVQPSLGWTVQAQTCGQGGIDPGGPVTASSGGGIKPGSEGNVVRPPTRLGIVGRLFLLEVNGVVPTATGAVERVYHETMLDVALVNNEATESLSGIRSQIEANGHTLEETSFQVKAYVTEAQAAAGNVLAASTRATVTAVDSAPGMLLRLPTPAETGARPAREEADSGSGGSCQPTQVGDAVDLTFGNGCISYSGSVYDQGAWHPEAEYSRNLGSQSALMSERIDDNTWFNLPSMAGYGQTAFVVSEARPTVKFKVVNADTVRVTTLWETRGDVLRSCNPAHDNACVAGGADLHASTWLAGSVADVNLLSDPPLYWCAPDTTPDIPIYRFIQPFVHCWLWVVEKEIDNGDHAFNNERLAIPQVIDVQQHPDWLLPIAQMTASISGAGPDNLPQFVDMRSHFVGFRIEAVST